MPERIERNNLCVNVDFENLTLLFDHISSGVFTSDVEMHHHGKYFYELHLICGGKGSLVTADGTFALENGDVFINGPILDHAQLTDKTNYMEEYCLGFNISRKRNKKDTVLSNLLQNTKFWIGKDDGTFLTYFDLLAKEIKINRIGQEQMIENILYAIVMNIVRRYNNETIPESIPIKSKDFMRIRLLEKHLEECTASSTEEQLCQEINLSRRQLLRFLKQQYGESYRELKSGSIASKGINMIKKGKTISEAAELLGYYNTEYFKNILKKHGWSPYDENVTIAHTR